MALSRLRQLVGSLQQIHFPELGRANDSGNVMAIQQQYPQRQAVANPYAGFGQAIQSFTTPLINAWAARESLTNPNSMSNLMRQRAREDEDRRHGLSMEREAARYQLGLDREEDRYQLGLDRNEAKRRAELKALDDPFSTQSQLAAIKREDNLRTISELEERRRDLSDFEGFRTGTRAAQQWLVDNPGVLGDLTVGGLSGPANMFLLDDFGDFREGLSEKDFGDTSDVASARRNLAGVQNAINDYKKNQELFKALRPMYPDEYIETDNRHGHAPRRVDFPLHSNTLSANKLAELVQAMQAQSGEQRRESKEMDLLRAELTRADMRPRPGETYEQMRERLAQFDRAIATRAHVEDLVGKLNQATKGRGFRFGDPGASPAKRKTFSPMMLDREDAEYDDPGLYSDRMEQLFEQLQSKYGQTQYHSRSEQVRSLLTTLAGQTRKLNELVNLMHSSRAEIPVHMQNAAEWALEEEMRGVMDADEDLEAILNAPSVGPDAFYKLLAKNAPSKLVDYLESEYSDNADLERMKAILKNLSETRSQAAPFLYGPLGTSDDPSTLMAGQTMEMTPAATATLNALRVINPNAPAPTYQNMPGAFQPSQVFKHMRGTAGDESSYLPILRARLQDWFKGGL